MPIALKAVIAVKALIAPISYSYELDLLGDPLSGGHGGAGAACLRLPSGPPSASCTGTRAPGPRARWLRSSRRERGRPGITKERIGTTKEVLGNDDLLKNS